MTKPFTVVVPTVVTDANFVSSTVLENDHPVWDEMIPYMVGERVVVTTGHHKIYESLTANTNRFPPMNPLDWIEVGPTNRWAAFDESGGTMSSAMGSIEFVLTGSGLDSFGFLDVKAASIRIRATSPIAPNYFDKTITLRDNAVIDSWFSYFTEPINRQTLAVEFGIPSIRDSTYTITVEGEGMVSIGTFVMGKQREFGFTEYGATISTKSYGRVEEDQFGRRTRVRRGFARRMNVSIFMERSVTDAVKRQFEDLRETPALWVAADGVYESLTIYGDYRDFSIVLSFPNHNTCNLEIEGIA